MQVACEHCSAEYEVEESEISGRGVRITCPSCSHVFVVYHTPQEPSFEMDIEIELDDNGELSMDLDAMLNSIIDETEAGTDKAKEVEGSESKKESGEELDFEVDVEFDNVQFENIESDKAQGDVVAAQNVPVQSELAADSGNETSVNQEGSAVDGVLEQQPDTNKTHDDLLQKVTAEQIASMDVHSLNFASVGIKSWKVKKPIGLMFEYSDYKTFQKSLNDGRISSGDQISPDGKEWTPMSDIEDFEVFFCKTYAEFEQKEVVPEVKTVKEKVIPSLGGTNELASALAAAQAEVEQANKPQTVRKSTPKRPNRKPQSKSSPPQPDQTKSSGLLVNAGIGLAVIIGVVLLFGGDDEVVVNNPTAPTKVVTDIKNEKNSSVEDESLKALREELRRDAAKIEAEQAPEPEPSSEEEPQLIAKVPEEILAQQRALKEGKAATPVKKTVDHALEGQQALQAQQWAKAIQSFTAAFQTNPNPEFLASVGFAQFKSGQLSSAKKTLMQASKKNSVTANKWLGYVLREEGDIAGSNQYFNQYLQSNPSDAALIKQEMMQ